MDLMEFLKALLVRGLEWNDDDIEGWIKELLDLRGENEKLKEEIGGWQKNHEDWKEFVDGDKKEFCKQIRKYARHLKTCRVMTTTTGDTRCDCGFKQILKANQ